MEFGWYWDCDISFGSCYMHLGRGQWLYVASIIGSETFKMSSHASFILPHLQNHHLLFQNLHYFVWHVYLDRPWWIASPHAISPSIVNTSRFFWNLILSTTWSRTMNRYIFKILVNYNPNSICTLISAYAPQLKTAAIYFFSFFADPYCFLFTLLLAKVCTTPSAYPSTTLHSKCLSESLRQPYPVFYLSWPPHSSAKMWLFFMAHTLGHQCGSLTHFSQHSGNAALARRCSFFAPPKVWCNVLLRSICSNVVLYWLMLCKHWF